MPELLALRASQIMRRSIHTPHGRCLGRIEELIVDLHGGAIAYVVLRHEAGEGRAGKRFAIPWHALCVEPADQTLRLNVEPEVFAAAPGMTDIPGDEADALDDCPPPALAAPQESRVRAGAVPAAVAGG